MSLQGVRLCVRVHTAVWEARLDLVLLTASRFHVGIGVW